MNLREHFFIPKNNYFNSAATTFKLKTSVNAVTDYYTHSSASVHRGVYELGHQATEKYENVRKSLAVYIGARSHEDIIFTKGTTEGLNLLAHSIELSRGVLVTRMEHHSNFVPWQVQASKKQVPFNIVELTPNGQLDINDLRKKLAAFRPSVLAITAMSNVLGCTNPIVEIAAYAAEFGTKVIVDAAQFVQHHPLNLKALGPIHALVFSGHKIFGPTGTGVLWMDPALIKSVIPYQVGGHTVQEVGDSETTYLGSPARFEAGTPNISGVLGLAPVVQFLQDLNWQNVRDHETKLSQAFIEEALRLDCIELYGSDHQNQGPIFAFNIRGVHPHDLATFLDSRGISLRAGHHCAQPLMRYLKTFACARVSFSLYNTLEEVDYLMRSLKGAKEFFRA